MQTDPDDLSLDALDLVSEVAYEVHVADGMALTAYRFELEANALDSLVREATRCCVNLRRDQLGTTSSRRAR